MVGIVGNIKQQNFGESVERT